MNLENIPPMTVEMIQTSEHSWSPKPSLKQWWPNAKKLAWKAGLVEHETGLKIRITKGGLSIGGKPVRGHYGVQFQNGAATTGTFIETWSFLNGFETGAKRARHA